MRPNRWAVGALLTLALGAWPTMLSGQEAKGNRAYRRDDYEKAVERYRRAIENNDGTPRVHFNLGTALLQLEEREEALLELSDGLVAQQPELRVRSFFNLGNALAEAVGGEGPPIEDLREAAEAYKRALLLDPNRFDAKWNLELTLTRIEEMEQAGQPQDQEQQQQPTSGDPGQDQAPRPDQGGSGSGTPRQPPPHERQPMAQGDEPLPKELADQILRAVEERERALQREKQRRRRSRQAGPDW